MSSLSSQYSERAAEMRRLAEAEPIAELRAELLQMAHGWEAMANRRARIEAEEASGRE